MVSKKCLSQTVDYTAEVITTYFKIRLYEYTRQMHSSNSCAEEFEILVRIIFSLSYDGPRQAVINYDANSELAVSLYEATNHPSDQLRRLVPRLTPVLSGLILFVNSFN